MGSISNEDSARRSRALSWSKEVERRVRDLYKRVWPESQRAKFMGREDREGHPDIVGLPLHVQVKARRQTWVGSQWRAAHAANQTEGPTHLVTQDRGHEVLVTMRLKDYIDEREKETCRKV